MHRRDERAGAGHETTRNRVGRVGVGRDERSAAPRHVGRAGQPFEVELAMPADDDGVGRFGVHRLEPVGRERLSDAGAAAHEHARPRRHRVGQEQRRRLRARADVLGVGVDSHAPELGDVVGERRARIVGEKGHEQPRGPQVGDGARRPRDRFLTPPDDTVEVATDNCHVVTAASAR